MGAGGLGVPVDATGAGTGGGGVAGRGAVWGWAAMSAVAHEREPFVWPTQRVVGNASRIPLRDEVTPCIISSPPYNVAIGNYPSGYADHYPWPVYAAKARLWAKEMYRILVPGGRVWLNVQQTVPMRVGDVGGERVNLAHLWMEALSSAGLSYRDTVCWVQDSFDGACAWGSWLTPSAPNLRGSSELILLYYKGEWKRECPPAFKARKMGSVKMKGWQDAKDDLGGDWVDLVRNVWKINPANKAAPGTRVPDAGNWPGAFPIEVPARAIRLSTWPNELVCDPFCGRGTTGWAAEQLGRKSVLLDLGF